MAERRFPPPLTVEALDGGFKIVDANKQAIAYVYGHARDPFEAKPGIQTGELACFTHADTSFCYTRCSRMLPSRLRLTIALNVRRFARVTPTDTRLTYPRSALGAGTR